MTVSAPTWHRTCHHRIYRLSCDEYTEQVERTGNRCQLCGVTAEKAGGAMLHIDHAAYIGQWAVRGLLCNRCNSLLVSTWEGIEARGDLSSRDVELYLADPWYRRLLVAAGVPETIAEPGTDVLVLVNGRPFRKIADGWRPDRKDSSGVRKWRRIVHAYGPREIEILPIAGPGADALGEKHCERVAKILADRQTADLAEQAEVSGALAEEQLVAASVAYRRALAAQERANERAAQAAAELDKAIVAAHQKKVRPRHIFARIGEVYSREQIAALLYRPERVRQICRAAGVEPQE